LASTVEMTSITAEKKRIIVMNNKTVFVSNFLFSAPAHHHQYTTTFSILLFLHTHMTSVVGTTKTNNNTNRADPGFGKVNREARLEYKNDRAWTRKTHHQ